MSAMERRIAKLEKASGSAGRRVLMTIERVIVDNTGQPAQIIRRGEFETTPEVFAEVERRMQARSGT